MEFWQQQKIIGSQSNWTKWYLKTIHFVTALSNILCTCSKSASAGVGKNHQEMGRRFLVMVKSHLSFIFLLNELFIHSFIIHFKIQFVLIQRLSLAKLYQKNKIDNWGLYSARQLYNLSIDFFTEGPSSNTFFKIGIHSKQGKTATTRYGVTRKRSTKRLKHTGNFFRKNLQLTGVW